MFDTISEITTAITERETDMNDLRNQMEDDFVERYTLAEYEVEKGYESYTSSAPRNFLDKVVDGINRADLSIQIKLPDDATEAERREASIGEQYVWGALDEINRNYRGTEPPLREQIAFFICVRGGVALRILVYEQKGKTVFDALSWDLLHTTWEPGRNGLLWGANKRKLSKAQIKAEYGLEINGKDAELIDWFDQERNAIIIDNVFAKKPTSHKIGHCPVGVFLVGSMPTLQDKTFKSTLEHRCQSVWAASRNLFDPMNKITSRTFDRYERSIVGSLVHKSKDGKAALPDGADPYRTFQEIKLAEGESLEPLQVPESPPETAILHSIVNRDIDQSTLPYPLSYGGTKQAMSGAALGVLVEGTRSVYSPRTSCLEQAYTWLSEELMIQYNERISAKSTIRGIGPNGSFFSLQVKPKEIDPGWYVVVSAQPKLPRDRQAEIMMSLAATQKRGPGDIPLVSKQTAREDIMQLKDPDSEKDKVYEEIGEGLEPIMIAQVVKALKDRGKDELAEMVLMLLSPPGAAGAGPQQPQLPPELLAAVVEALAMNPETAPLAEAIVRIMTGGQGMPGPMGPPGGGGPMPGAPPGGPMAGPGGPAGMPPGAPMGPVG